MDNNNRAVGPAVAPVIIERKTKLVGLWPQRFGWACVISRSELWGELPIEINRIIVSYLVETHYQCVACPGFIPFDKDAFLCDGCFALRESDDGGWRFGRAMTVQAPAPANNIQAFWGHNL
jgi:hypothetical protein